MKTLEEKQFAGIIEKINSAVNYEFDSKFAVVYGVIIDKDLSITMEKIDAAGDVYDLIDVDNTTLMSQVNNYDMITIATCGWAAPITSDDDEDNDVAPSQHPQKRRVRLVTSANINGQSGSTILFQDDIENPVYDYGNAKGSLADAITHVLSVAKNKK
jgi:hypothetical protein